MNNERRKALIVAYYISKFDETAYKNLGLGSVTGTHSKIGKILGIKGTTIQNMRDEFDPHHDNPRKGWWQRGLFPSRQAVLDKFEGHTELELRELVEQIISTRSLPENISDELDDLERQNPEPERDKNWSDEELEIAINSYLYLLKMRIAGIDYPSSKMTKFLLDGPLKLRGRPTLRTRMRNISDVLDKMGFPILEGFTPAPKFGKNVRSKIERLVEQHLDELNSLVEQVASGSSQTVNPTLDDVLVKLQNLEKNLDSMKRPSVEGMGHNNPPSPLEDDVFDDEEVKKSIENLREELLSYKPDKKKIDTNQNVLIGFGFKLITWSKERVTDFSKAASVAAGTGFGAWATGLGSQVIDIVKTLAQYFGG